ncbi:MAG: hypothetical protein ACD_46C00113G0002 [uncultured bacterium]|nr:MAG: hypothetical protein ACD_46C00113G0002 [uncultured bacterium]
MMFLFHIAFTLGLIALAIGTLLYMWSLPSESRAGVILAKWVGLIVTIFAILALLCIGYYGIKYGLEGYLQSPMGLHGMTTKNSSMMENKSISGEEMGTSNMMNNHPNKKTNKQNQ